MSQGSPGAFRVAIIALAVGLHRTDVARALRGLSPAGHEIVNGREWPTYNVDSLPERIRSKLEVRARALSITPEAVLLNAAARKPWQARLPYSRANPAAQDKARRLREAFRWVFENHESLPFSEVMARGIAEYERAFGRTISERHWRNLYERTTARAGALEDFDRLDIYLDERVGPAVAPCKSVFDVRPVEAAVSLIKDPEQPTSRERDTLFSTLIDLHAGLCRSGADSKKAKKWILREALRLAPGISKSPAALAEVFRQKVKKVEDGKPIADRRRTRSGRKPQIEIDMDLLVARMGRNRGRLLSSWKELWDEGKLSATAYEFGNRDAPPERIRQAARGDFQLIRDQVTGPKHARLHGAKMVRTWDGLPSGTEAQCDDMTGNNYFFVERPEGRYTFEGIGFDLLRGQFLPWIDTRTGYIYCFSLLANESYGSLDIVRGLIALHDRIGLPRRLYLERGIWESSSIIAGRRDEFDMQSRISGLQDLGVQVAHAHDPSAKVVERIFGELQNYMDKLPGYAGRNERIDLPEATAAALQEVRSGRSHPAKHFLNFDEIKREYEKACDRYNDTPGGKNSRIAGMTPREAFVRLLDPESAPAPLPEKFRYLLATNRRREKIGPQGIRINIGSTSYVYRSEAMGARRGETVMAYFDLEDPSWITFTDLNGENPETAPRATSVPAMGADKDTIRKASREAAAFDRPARERISELKRAHPEEFPRPRQILTDRKSLDLAETIDTHRKAAQVRTAAENRTRDHDRVLVKKAGLAGGFDPRRAANQRDAAKGLLEFLESTPDE